MDIYIKYGVLQGWLREGNLKMRRKLLFWEAWLSLLSKVGILPTCVAGSHRYIMIKNEKLKADWLMADG